MMHDRAPRYQHVQPGTEAYDSVYRDALNYLNGAVLQMSSSPNLYTTKSTSGLLQQIANHLAQLKLEEQLFRQASPEWRKRFAEREIVTQRQALLRLKEKLVDSGGQFLQRYRVNMDHGNVTCTTERCADAELGRHTDEDNGIGWTDTSVRAAHAWAQSELSDFCKELEPLAIAAQKRIQQYTDLLDITDRYSGYRRNLGYLKRRDPNDQSALEITLENNMRPSIAPRWHLGPEWTRAEAVGTQNYTAPGDINDCKVDQNKFMERYNTKMDPREMAGIVTRFPGRSEYQDTYIDPLLVETGMNTVMPPATYRSIQDQPEGVRGRGSMVGIDPSQVQIKDYLVNPTPNFSNEFSLPGKLQTTEQKPPISETHDRFRWPDMPKQQQVFLPME